MSSKTLQRVFKIKQKRNGIKKITRTRYHGPGFGPWRSGARLGIDVVGLDGLAAGSDPSLFETADDKNNQTTDDQDPASLCGYHTGKNTDNDHNKAGDFPLGPGPF
jgi:hypothetical protein